MFFRFGLILIFAACIVPFEKAYGGVVTLGNGGATSSVTTGTFNLYIRLYTTPNGAASFNLKSIQLKSSGNTTDTVVFRLYDSTGTSIINNITGSGTMTNGFLDLSGKNSFAGGNSAKVYVLEIAGLANSTYYGSSQRTNLPISDTTYFSKAY